MKFLTIDQMRAADQAAVSECNIPEPILMRRAGVALARAVARTARLRGARRIVLVAGCGNNGGDVCVAARCLHNDGFKALLIITCVPDTLKGAALSAWDDMRKNGVPFEVVASEESWRENLQISSGSLLNYGVVVDGVLGTGCRGAARGVAAEAIRWINSARPYALVIAADIPSGMNGDTGEARGVVVNADVTVTFAAPKLGFSHKSAMPLLGHLVVADIGIPDEIAFKRVAQSEYQMIARSELKRLYNQRSWSSHKGNYGHLCVIGGVESYPNAPVLSALGALRGGAGLITLRSCRANSGCVGAMIPEVILSPLALEEFYAATDAERAKICALDSFDVVVAGPGLGRSEGAAALVRYLLDHFKGSLVLDADALNLLAEFCRAGYSVPERRSLVITPHPGEAARLLHCEIMAVRDNRVDAVKGLARQYNAIAVLKGAGTLVCDGESPPWLNLTGNPGMATAGAGDVLAGVIGGLLAQGLEPLTAATMGVWAHGAAGDLAAFKGSQSSLTAGDLADMLALVWQDVERG